MFCKSILIVEDDVDIRNHVSQALELEDYETVVVGNGQEALDYLLGITEEKYPSCILLDLMMPIMDGRTFMQVIHEKYQSTLGKISIIVATAKGGPTNPGDLPYAMEMVKKPFELEELYRVVNEHCNKPQRH